MATIEHTGLLKYVDGNNNINVLYPEIGKKITLADYLALPEEEQKTGAYWIEDANEPLGDGSRFLRTTDVVDSLDSADSTLPLSANMGRILYGEDISSDCVYPYAIGNAIADVSAFKRGRHYSISFKINLASLSDKVYVATIKSDYCPTAQIAINVICFHSSTYTYYPASGFILRNGNIYVACDAQIDVAFVSMEYDV